MSYNRSNPKPSSSAGDTQYNVRDAALRGASSAFSKPPVKPKPLTQTYTGSGNGALTAATRAGAGHHSSPLQKQCTGGSYQSLPSPVPWSAKSNGSSTLEPPIDPYSSRATSPSNIAAKLVAARCTPLKSSPDPIRSYFPPMRASDAEEQVHEDVLPHTGTVGDAKAQRVSAGRPQPQTAHDSYESDSPLSRSVAGRPQDVKATDDTPILPTNSLVQLFEQARSKTPAQPSSTLVLTSRGAPPPVKSPKPQRKLPFVLTDEEMPTAQTRSIAKPAIRPKPDHPTLAAIKTTVKRPQPPAPRRSRPRLQAVNSYHSSRPLSGSLDDSTHVSPKRPASLDGLDENDSSPTSYTSAPETQFELKSKPALPPPRRSGKPRNDNNDLYPGSEPNSKSVPPKSSSASGRPTSSRQPSRLHTPPESFLPPRTTTAPIVAQSSGSTYHSNYQRQALRNMTPYMTGDSLANAMVGAALASSRTASPAPSRSPLPPLPIRAQPPKKHHHPFHSSRSPSPTKSKQEGRLRTTMRKEPSSSDSEDSGDKYKRKGKRVLGVRRKHPNKHHEGDRKRWRDVITERERKRYEGVWAANKGLLITTHPSRPKSPSPSPNRATVEVCTDLDPAYDVHALVVRDVWARSRLPEHVLEEVWNLVDSRGNARLRREEFVVGLWLVDQRLKGRKLPPRVGESVWGSVRGVGIRVKVGKG